MKQSPQNPEGDSNKSKKPKKTSRVRKTKSVSKKAVSVEEKVDVPAYVHDAIK